MDATARVSQSVEVRADPATAFQLDTGGINRWWRRDSWYWNDRRPAEPALRVHLQAEGAGRPSG